MASNTPPLTPEDVLWLLNQGTPLPPMRELRVLVVIGQPYANTGFQPGDVLLIDGRQQEVLAPFEKGGWFGPRFRRVRRAPKGLQPRHTWTTTDARAAWELGQKIKQPHDPGNYRWDGKAWNITDLGGRGRQASGDQFVVHLD
jgi:hypothetical protein